MLGISKIFVSNATKRKIFSTNPSIQHPIRNLGVSLKLEQASSDNDSQNNAAFISEDIQIKGKPFKEIPGPNPIPILGNAWRFFPVIGEYGNVQENILNFLQSVNKTYGDIVRMENIIGQRKDVHLYNPDDIEHVYKSEGIIPKRTLLPSMEYFRKTFRQDIFKEATGLLTSDGEEWYTFRNKVNPIMMQPKMVKQYLSAIDTIVKEFIAKIKRIRGTDDKISVNFLEEVNKWALESIAYLALNNRLNCLSDNIPEDSISFSLLENSREVFEITGKLDFQPSLWKYFATPTFKKGMRLYNEQVSLGQTLINEAMKRITEKGDETNENNEELSVLEKLLKIDKNVAIVMTLDMLLAGVDTTSTALVNILYYLAINPDKQSTLRNEILSVLQDEMLLTIEHLNHMPYVKACIKEAARLYPVTPGTMRILTKDTVLSGYLVPKGVTAFFPHMYLSLKEDQFPSPEKYLPERWLRNHNDPKLSYKNAHAFCCMHFGFGSRSCIGRRFAELELEIAVIHFIKNFKLSWEGPPPKRITSSINHLKGPFNFTFNNASS